PFSSGRNGGARPLKPRYDHAMGTPWPPEEQKILERLDALVSTPVVAAKLDEIGRRGLGTPPRGPRGRGGREAAPPRLYGSALSSDIGSSWVFALRHGVTTGAERHPNSRQRMVSWSGGGDFQVHDGRGWSSHLLVSDRRAPFERRWLSIPPETWHQGVVGETDWLVVSFHTVGPGGLIEERPG